MLIRPRDPLHALRSMNEVCTKYSGYRLEGFTEEVTVELDFGECIGTHQKGK